MSDIKSHNNGNSCAFLSNAKEKAFYVFRKVCEGNYLNSDKRHKIIEQTAGSISSDKEELNDIIDQVAVMIIQARTEISELRVCEMPRIVREHYKEFWEIVSRSERS